MKRVAHQKSFINGQASDRKEGANKSFAYSRCVDFRTSPTRLFVNPRTVKESAAIIDTEVTHFEPLEDGKVYAAGDTKIYLRTPPASAGAAATWTAPHTGLTNVKSMAYRADLDYLYASSDDNMHSIQDPGGSPTLTEDFIGLLLDVDNNEAGAAYHVPSAIVEGSKYKAVFDADKEQYISIDDGDQTGLDITGDISVIARVKLNNYNSPRAINSKYSTTSNQRSWMFRVETTGALAFFYSSDGTSTNLTQLTSDPVFADYIGKEVVVAVSVDVSAKTASFSVDGKIVATATVTGSATSVNNSTAPYSIGSYGDTASFWDGEIYSVATFADRLTVQEVKDFTQNLSGAEANLDAYHDFADDAFTDKTSNGNDLTGNVAIQYHDPLQASFTPELEQLKKLQIYVTDKDSGNLTVTIHDDQHNVVATKEVLNAALVNNEWNDFELASVVDLNAHPDAWTYHVHVTASSGDSYIRMGTAGDERTISLRTYANPLKSGVEHPVAAYLQYILVGNGRHVAVWEPLSDAPTKLEFESHKLTLPAGYEAIGIAEGYKEFVAIAARKIVSGDYGSSYGEGATEGAIFLWDGISDNYVFYEKINEGAPESIKGDSGRIMFIASGTLYAWAGNTSVPIRSMPGTEKFRSAADNHDADVYLQAPTQGMTMRKGILHIGFPYRSANDNVEIGVHSFGTNRRQYSPSFGFEHVPSHGRFTQLYDGSDVPVQGITAIRNMGTDLLIAWRDLDTTVKYGVDVVRDSNDAYESARIDLLGFDGNAIWKDKEAVGLKIIHTDMPSGASVQPQWRQVRGTDGNINSGWDNHAVIDDTEANTTYMPLTDVRFKELETRFDITTTGESPEIMGLSIEYDTRSDEGV